MTDMDTDTVLDYLESITDNLDVPDQMIEDMDIVSDWINELLDIQLDSDTLAERLQDGVILCQLTNALSSTARLAGVSTPPPPGIRRYHKKCKAESIQARDNVSSFCLWCMLYEVPPVLIPSADDVVMARNTPTVVSLLLYLVRRSANFTPAQTLSRKSSVSSSGSCYDRFSRRSFSRGTGKSLENCFNDMMNQRKNARFRTRSQSVDSEGSLCSSSSPAASNEASEAETLIRDLNLACRNISKKIVVTNVDIPGYHANEQLHIERSLGEESQACIRKKNRLFQRSNTIGTIDTSNRDRDLTGKRRFVLKSGSKKPEDVDISGEKLSLEDTEYLLLSTADNVAAKIRSVYKLLALRVLENQSRSNGKRVTESVSDMTLHGVYPPFTFATHSARERVTAFRTLKSFLISKVSDNDDVMFSEVHELWNRRYQAEP